MCSLRETNIFLMLSTVLATDWIEKNLSSVWSNIYFYISTKKRDMKQMIKMKFSNSVPSRPKKETDN